jgi:hypothetical protein
MAFHDQGSCAIAASASAQRSVFEVDPVWPKQPPQFKLGSVELRHRRAGQHRPRTLKPEDSGKAAPAIVVFDAAATSCKGRLPAQHHGPERWSLP